MSKVIKKDNQMYLFSKRIFDIIFSIVLIIILSPLLLLIGVLIFLDDPGPIIFKQSRVGLNKKVFTIYKFRSMKKSTPNIATHLMGDPKKHITRVGRFIRKTSLDEIPQILNILRGEMSFVGPRPALYNQYDLIDLREKFSIHRLLPGITGLAQIKGRDDLNIEVKVAFDKEYLDKFSFFEDLRILFLTLFVVIFGRGYNKYE